MTDTISDMLTRIRNGHMAGKREVLIPSSKMKIAIAKVLQEEGYIQAVEEVADGIKKSLKVQLKYNDSGIKAIRQIKRVSKPSRRVYVNKNSIPRTTSGMGITILSTSRGIMTGTDARTKGIGGEILCTVV